MGIRVRNFQHQGNYIAGDKVWYQYKDGNAWHGQAEVIYQKANVVFIHSNGDVKKVAACKVKPYDLKERTDEEEETEVLGTNEMAAPEMISKAVVQSNVPGTDQLAAPDEEEEANNDEEKSPEIREEENKAENDDKKEENETEIEEIEDENEVRRDLQNDIIGAKYLQVEKSVYLMDYEIFSLEVPVKDHGKPEIVEAKNNEIENLKHYKTFEEVIDEGQKTIGSRWVITEKQKHDGQKQDYKARLVAQGFKEIDQPQSDSPTAAKESFKLLLALSANFGFKIVSMDIRAAFLQAKTLDREVFVRPPRDIEKPGIIWKLLKPLYGLDDASRKF